MGGKTQQHERKFDPKIFLERIADSKRKKIEKMEEHFEKNDHWLLAWNM